MDKTFSEELLSSIIYEWNLKQNNEDAEPLDGDEVETLIRNLKRELNILQGNQNTNKFFTYGQNNSGGFFTGPAEYVIVEAKNNEEADLIAEMNGVYFDGYDSGRDCSCCGSRWSRSCRDDGTDEPEIYGQKPNEEDDYILILK